MENRLVNFDIGMRIITDNQQFPKKRIGHFSTPLKWQGMEKAAANLNGDETGNGRYSQ
jgi:hypothetical protein